MNPDSALGEAARGFSFELREADGRLELRAPHHPRYGAVYADWASPEVRRRVAGGRRQLLARAVGLHKNPAPRVLDATAGLGRDGYVLAALGARVTLLERHPMVAALLRDALRRAAGEPAAAHIEVCEGQARDFFGRGNWDAIYLDPMYPDEGKAALAKKELQFLRELTGGDPDADALLEPALAAGPRRVVVKRPLKAPWLARRKPDLELKGTQARFDVYVPAPTIPR
ncbi:MAG: class I SAM-dependent methyltransferase [Gammaproteobacteria bacterium]|nr:class I SAM-dependent methyltransferase [Gammaproteobacteria bacterium]